MQGNNATSLNFVTLGQRHNQPQQFEEETHPDIKSISIEITRSSVNYRHCYKKVNSIYRLLMLAFRKVKTDANSMSISKFNAVDNQ
jgi:hypothetical protein